MAKSSKQALKRGEYRKNVLNNYESQKVKNEV